MTPTDDIIFHVDETSDLPIWAQLRNRIAYLIRTGFFAAGDQLPSVRSLAADASINYNTVTKAYRDLELSRLIVSVRGRGMFVQKTSRRKTTTSKPPTPCSKAACSSTGRAACRTATSATVSFRR